jgi:hypothetical protein
LEEKVDFLIYLKPKKSQERSNSSACSVALREISISTFRKRLEIKEELTGRSGFETSSNLLEIDN